MNSSLVEYRPVIILVDDSGIKDIELGVFNKKNIYFGKNEFKNDIVIKSDNVADVQGRFIVDEHGLSICDVERNYGIFVANDEHFKRIDTEKPYQCCKDLIIDVGSDDPDTSGNSVVMICSDNDEREVWRNSNLREGRNVIGRDEYCDIVLDDVSVSKIHAYIYKDGSNYIFENDKKTDTVIINGKAVSGYYQLKEKDIIQIASSKLIFIKGRIIYKTFNKGIQLTVKNLSKVVGHGNNKKAILSNADCVINSNEFVAIIGGSGAGKTTLMNAMSGYDSDISGEVLINGIDLHDNFDALKNEIGYVPQQDIIYENLKLKRMLYYTAKMKMPPDTSKTEINSRIEEVLEMVGLSEHKNTYIRKLSGGQKKRASIAVELLANPSLFFLDEPTSGLDPYIEESLMRTLRKLSKEQGKTVIMVTHTTANINLCDKVIVMGEGGRVCFCDHASKFQETFGGSSIIDVYSQVSKNSLFWENVEREKNINVESIKKKEKKKVVINKGIGLNQLGVIVSRYFELIKNDYQLLLMLILQPVVVAFLLNIVAEEGVFDIYEPTKSILFALACAGIWIGLFDAIQEITKERVILKREYMGNLKLRVYMLSKAFVLGIVSLIQSAIMIIIFSIMVGGPDKGMVFDNSYFEMLVVCTVTVFVSVMMGLSISAIAKQGDRAMALAPFVLMYQLLFSGILFELKDYAKYLSYFTVSRWAMEAYGSIANLNKLDLKLSAIPGVIHKSESLFERTDEHLLFALGAMACMAVFFFLLSIIVLRRMKNEQR